MDDLLREFLTESAESLAVLDLELVKLEQNPNNPDLLGNIFRLVHTIKGTCGFLGLPRLESVAHASENVLGKVRDGELEVTPEIVSVILKSLDRIKSLLSALEQTEAEPAGDDTDLKDQLNAIAEGKALPKAATPAAAAAPAPTAAPTVVEKQAEAELAAAAEAHAEASRAAAVAAIEEQAAREPSVAAQSIRVHVNLLENLMTMVSELVLTRNQLLQILRSQKESEFAAPLQRLNLVTSELQEGVMKTRMQPIGNAWAKLPRMVRDLAHELNKKIDLKMQGAETELDRQVLELIKDPLTHLVRNCADHGLEGPEDRRKAGKPDTGRITLDAYHEGGQIVIEISDDGRGLPIEKIKAKALANGLAAESELASMSDEQIQQFIFRAGFSTAAQVTNVSGRGVGMDVVRTNIEKIGGTIELRSKAGRGTSFFIKIPLTLAIVSALIVEAGNERFAIPQISVIELVRATANSSQRIEHINGAPFLRLRNRLLPLVNLSSLLKIAGAADKKTEDACIVVTQVGKHTFGIVVDRVFDTEEIVVKPVAPILRDISMFAGNTILGDGSVIMILDPNGIAAAIGDAGMSHHDQSAETATAHASTKDERVALLLFRAGGDTPKAVPLALVARLEEVDVKAIEISDGKPVLQYRGKLMPLVTIDPAYSVKTEGRQPILVFADGNRSMGLLVDEIVDIVEERMNVQLGTEKTGLLGSAIIAGKATEIIDAGHYLTVALDTWFDPDKASADGTKSDAKRILLVDDSPFFRNLLTPLLSVAGYDVTSVEGADKALALCEAGKDFDVIVSDIEMPGMSGFEFAEAVKSGRWQNTPIVALSAHTSAKDLDRGRKVGFVDYIAKLDRDALLNTLTQTITTRGAA
ncbi:MAG TPA: chemotaxis protein CheW [Alphaproteobacteria bacterium]|nr:chemotaxis protein CheW [Alphaproteobacteria bacterium]